MLLGQRGARGEDPGALRATRPCARRLRCGAHQPQLPRGDSAEAAKRIAAEKFAFKGIKLPTPQQIVDGIDKEGLQANWDQQLRHQLPNLPGLGPFLAELVDAISWWMQPELAQPSPTRLAPEPAEQVLPRAHFRRPWTGQRPGTEWLPDEVRFAARNRLLARISYHGSERTIEPYSLRQKGTGNVLLYGYEVDKAGIPTGGIKAYKVQEIVGADVLDGSFAPRWTVEL